MKAFAFLARRLLSTLPMLLLVGLITFLMIHLTPGDPAAVVAGDNASLEAIEAARQRLGLNAPLPVQFWHWLVAVVHGDLGTSFTSGRPVTRLILERLPITLSLTFGATLIGLVVAIPLGIFAAVQRDSWLDRLTVFTTSLGIAAPEFFIGLLLVLLFAIELGWLPATGYVPFWDDPVEWARRLILPSLALGLGVAAELTRQVRGAMRDVLARDYIQTARGQGAFVVCRGVQARAEERRHSGGDGAGTAGSPAARRHRDRPSRYSTSTASARWRCGRCSCATCRCCWASR